MLITCPTCKKDNRLPRQATAKIRCGNKACGHVFTPSELTKARPEPPKPFTITAPDDDDEEEEDKCDECGRKLDEDGLCSKCDED